ncbi:MAG TPA: hypothetical protein VFQ25_06020 [Ktedonobacterales bacterium]|nr:hypothetical protein [Ktedonobacterales bacterium]
MARNIERERATASAAVSRRGMLLGAGGVAAGVALGGLSSVWRPGVAQAAGSDSPGSAIVRFHTMAPVTGAFVGAGGTPIRGIHGGGLPWALDLADGELRGDGRLRVRVRGLVLAAGPATGTNPIPTFRAIVSFENAAPIFTDPVPASTTGDAEIDTHIDLPRPGFAPIIFVGPGAFVAWFAVTGVM